MRLFYQDDAKNESLTSFPNRNNEGTIGICHQDLNEWAINEFSSYRQLGSQRAGDQNKLILSKAMV